MNAINIGTPMGKLAHMPNSLLASRYLLPNTTLCDMSWMARVREWFKKWLPVATGFLDYL